MRREKRTGSIYQRSGNGLWACAVEVGPVGARRRKVFTGKTREIVEAKLAAWHAEHPPAPHLPAGSLERRRELRQHPDAHTAAEWSARCGEVRECPYCGVPLNVWNRSKDHRVPIARGGDDSIANVTPCCAPCNRRKATLTDIEFMATLAGQPVAAARYADA